MNKLITIIPVCLLYISTLAQSGGTSSDPAAYVNPFVGTAAHGHTFPGATLPFGMVQLSPDTRVDNSWDGCSGYHYSDSIIYGFSHTHLSGTGVSDYGDIMLMPVTGTPGFAQKDYAAVFSHDNESASPGYYSVLLNNGIKVELTATTRAGFHKYTFPKGKSSVILDLTHRDMLIEGEIQVLNNSTIAVKRRSHAWATDQHAYAWIVFSKPFTHTFNPEKTKAIFEFSLKPEEALLIKVGFSFVSTEGAEKNMLIELPHRDFERVKREARAAWNRELGKIEVSDRNTEKLRTFYTALYHVMIHPNVACDVDGNYRGRDNKIHNAQGFTYYTVFSLWDTFRATHPLFTLIDRKRTLDFIKTFLLQYSQGGRLPVWELASNETDCMIGYHSVSVIADAVVKGIRDFDLLLAFEAMKKSATWNHLGLPEYMKQGFLSIDDEHESVSKTLEYAYDDWCIAQIANLFGNTDDYNLYMTRSQAWKNLLDPDSRLMRPRKNGGWYSPFDPHEVNNHFTEGNSWQYSFFVPHDVYGMIDMMGGPSRFESKLDELFTTSQQTTGRDQADITGLIGQYAHGNEPSHHMAYLYHYVGKPQKTAERVHQILGSFYSSMPDGLIGNEDCGQMSAWYVLSAMGLYQTCPGTNYFLLSNPFLEKVQINLENGNTFRIKGPGNQKSWAAIKLNGSSLENPSFINYNTLMEGGELSFESGVFTDKTASFFKPPQQPTVESIIPVPVITAASRAFKDSLVVTIQPLHHDYTLHYTTNGSDPDENSAVYKKNIILRKSAMVKAIGINKNKRKSAVSQASFFSKDNNYSITILSKYSSQYTAGGDEGLIDGIRGDKNWRKGDWQGYQGQDFEAVVDLKSSKKIKSVSAGFLQDTRAWILMPKKVEFYISEDGIYFTLMGSAESKIEDKDMIAQTENLEVTTNTAITARYIKVKAINYGELPAWHLGAGGKSYIFVDEIVISF